MLRIKDITLHPFAIPMHNGQTRSGVLIALRDQRGDIGWGEISPLPNWSDETLEMAIAQIEAQKEAIIKTQWTGQNCYAELKNLALLPSVSFGLESALLSILSPLKEYTIEASALLMGSTEEIFQQANLRYHEGYQSAKLKVGNLNFSDALEVINQLKDKFRLRVDVNRAWKTKDSLKFFSRFPLDAFDYVEEPFQNPNDLVDFTHPLAVDESFPKNLSLEQLQSLPNLKAVIYKPTIQGGLLGCLPLYEWAKVNGIEIVISSSFESNFGLSCVASIAHRLGLKSPVGIGTHHYLNSNYCKFMLHYPKNGSCIG